MKLIKGELSDRYNVGITLQNYVFMVYDEDTKPISFKVGKNTTFGGYEKMLAKLFPTLLKFVSLKIAGEIMVSLYELAEKRGLGNHYQDFNLRLVTSDFGENYDLQGWF